MKITLPFHITPIRNLTNSKAGEASGGGRMARNLCVTIGEANWSSHCGINMEGPQKPKLGLLSDPAVPLL